MAPTNDARFGIPLKGSLRRTPFARILRQLARARATGSLYLLSGQVKKVVFFDNGQPIFVRSNVVAECLGQILVRDGLINEKQCEQSLETIRRTGKKQGQLFVEMGILSAGNLQYALESQLRHKLFDVFGWGDGRYQFKPDAQSQDFGLRLRVSAAGIILAAVLETFSEERAEAGLAEVAEHFPIKRASTEDDLELLPSERFVFDSLDGSRSLAELLKHEWDPRPPALPGLLHGLVQSGLCQLSKIRRPEKPAPTKPASQRQRPDSDFLPPYPASQTITEFEDTPVPGQLPQRVTLSPNPEQGGAGVSDSSPWPSQSSSLERLPEDSFEEDVVLIEDDELELIDDQQNTGQITEPRAVMTRGGVDGDSDLFDPTKTLSDAVSRAIDRLGIQDGPLIEVDDRISLAQIDLDADIDALTATSSIQLPAKDGRNGESNLNGLAEESPEIAGAILFNKGQDAIESGEWKAAIQHLDAAYANGIDVAELHAMLAFARFKASGEAPALADHAIELLAYAEDMNPDLDLIYAYRGAVLESGGDSNGARRELERALALNERCEIAQQLMARMSS